MDEKFAYCIVA